MKIIILVSLLFSISSHALDLLEQGNLLVDHLEKKYNYSETLERPLSCPMGSQKYDEILKKIIEVKNGLRSECVSKNAGAIDGLNTTISSIDELNKKISEDAEETTSENQEMLTNVTSTLKTFSNLAQKEECSYDLKKNGALSIIADIIIEVSTLGMIVPGTNGLLIAGGSAIVGSTLKIIDDLMKNRFDWTEVKDRETFVKLNCSFFDIRREIERSGMLNINLKEHQLELADKEEDLRKLELLQKDIFKQYTVVTELATANLNNYFIDQFGEDSYTIFDSLKKYKKIVETEGIASLSFDKQGELIKTTFETKELLSELLPKLNLGPYGNIKISQTIEELNKLIPTDLIFDNFVLIYFSEIEKFVKLTQDLWTKISWLNSYFDEFEQEVLSSLSFNNDYLKDKENNQQIAKPYIDTLKRLSIMQSRLQKRVEFLKSIVNGEFYSATDNGSFPISAIIEEYKDIQDTIYGKQGESFLKYLVKNGRSSIKSYKKNYTKTMGDTNKNASFDEVNSKIELSVSSCSNAIDLRFNWNRAYSLSSVGYDFVYTNMDLFHQNAPKFKKILGIPVGKSSQKNIYYHTKSALLAQMLIDGKKISKDGHKLLDKKRYLGHLMMNVHGEKRSVSHVQRFIDLYNCENHD